MENNLSADYVITDLKPLYNKQQQQQKDTWTLQFYRQKTSLFSMRRFCVGLII